MSEGRSSGLSARLRVATVVATLRTDNSRFLSLEQCLRMDCPICLQPIIICDGDLIVLACADKFHRTCWLMYEEKEFDENMAEKCRCPLCRECPIDLQNGGPRAVCLCVPADPDRCRYSWLVDGWECKVIADAKKEGN